MSIPVVGLLLRDWRSKCCDAPVRWYTEIKYECAKCGDAIDAHQPAHYIAGDGMYMLNKGERDEWSDVVEIMAQ